MLMKKSLIEAFNIERKPSKVDYVSDYEIFPDKKLLDDLRTKIVENLIDKEIPEDKKSFVAKMDAVTGITTTVVQLSTGLLLANKKVQSAICKRLFSELKDNPKKFKQASAGFATVSTLIGATLLAKRILVPLISSPIAGYLENKHKQKSNLK